jgi:hypothetical protein
MGDLFYDFLGKTIGQVLWKSEVNGLENIIPDEPGVFIANHSGSLGPESILSSMPFHLHTWILQQTVDRKRSAEYLRRDFVERELRLKPPFSKVISFLMALIAVPLLKALNTIPVYKSSKQLENRTFQLTLEILTRKEYVLIFPEDPKPVPNQSINPFQTGFTRLGELYYKRTGKDLVFYPLTFHSGKRKIMVGKPVFYDPKNPFHRERNRLSSIIEKEIHENYRKMDSI